MRAVATRVSRHDAELPATSALVRAAQAGDRDAFAALYHRHARLAHAVLLGSVPPDDARDLLQNVFLVALRELPKLRDVEAFGGWIVQIARNEARMHHRARRPMESIDDDAALGRVHTSRATLASLASRASADVDVDARLDAERIMGQVRELPEKVREPLLMRLVEGMSGDEIARATGLTHGTVRVYLHEGMRLLRERLRERE